MRGRSRESFRRAWVGIVGCILLALIATLIVGPLAAADQARLVRDIAPGEAGSNPVGFMEVGDKLIFAANDGSFGYQLWASDGTTANTQRLTNFPSFNFNSEFGFVERTVVQETAYFAISSVEMGLQIWRSDGTRSGTKRVKVFSTGDQYTPIEITSMTAVGNTLYFVLYSLKGEASEPSRELWKSDGTEAGTQRVSEISATQLTDVNGTLFFVAADTQHGAELWKSDGTAVGTGVVRDINPGRANSNPVQLTNMNGTLFFVANADGFTTGRELWKSDGTASGTVQVKDIYAGDASSSPTDLTAVGNAIFFTAYTPQYGRELWRSDGTSAGTSLVRDIESGSRSSALYQLINVDTILYFVSGYVRSSDVQSFVLLWRSDGTQAGTYVLRGLSDYFSPVPTEPPFLAETPSFTEAPAATTAPPSPNSPIRAQYPSDGPIQIVPAQGGFFFLYDDVIWRSDGTSKGTFDVHSNTIDYYPITFIINAGEFLYFVSSDEPHGSELWTIPVDPALYVRLLTYLPVIRDSRPTPTEFIYPIPIWPTVAPTVTVTATTTLQQ